MDILENMDPQDVKFICFQALHIEKERRQLTAENNKLRTVVIALSVLQLFSGTIFFIKFIA